MPTLLARKSGPQDNAIATDDDHHQALASDPGVSAFPQGSSFGGGFNSAPNNTTSGFGAATPAQPTSSFGGGSFGSAPPATPTSGTIGGSHMPAPTVSITQNQGESLKNTGGAMQEGADVLVKNTNEDWINKKWRPVMGWVYMGTCTCDFVLFPVLWSLLQALSSGQVTSQWQPLTLQGAGLYHIAMGAVLGIAAYGRTKEKVEGKQ